MKKNIVFLLVTFLFVSCLNSSKTPVEPDDTSLELVDESTLDSLAVEEFRTLYNELMNFKNEKEFREAGLAGKQEYIDWCNNVKSFQDRETERLIKKKLLPGELRTLADLYVSSKGKETKDTNFLQKEFEAAFTQIANKESEFKVVEPPINKKETTPQKNVLGKWKAQSKYLKEMNFTIEIYEIDRNWFSKTIYYDGSSSEESLKKDGKKFIKIENDFQEYYEVSGNKLKIGGEHGIIDDFIITRI